MPSYTIPEEVIGIPLFVPEDNNYFTIEDPGLPNGDPCLVVNGAVSTNYKAFQPAQTLTPDCFKSRTPEWAMTFWFKCSSTTDPSSSFAGISHTLMGVQTAAGPSSYSDVTNYVWNWGVNNAAGTPRISCCMNSGGSASYAVGVRDGNWHLITLNVTSSGSGNNHTMYVDGNTTGVSAAKSGVPGTTGMFFSIGAYGAHANSQGYNQQWRIGKLAFHAAMLNETERQLLYNTMFA